MAKQILKNDWANYLQDEFSKEYYVRLREILKEEYKTQTIYPEMHDIFNALHFTPFHQVKVVILGQDPYHGPNKAHGLSLSVQRGIALPPSLRNILNDLQKDIVITLQIHGFLSNWAKQGVLLFNAVLTVRAGEAHSHQRIGWEQPTNELIQSLDENNTP